jgi:hypothetical protein
VWKRFIQNNFSIFAAGSLLATMTSGWMCLSYIQKQETYRLLPAASKENETTGNDDVNNKGSKRIKSREEFRLEAMVENALKSSWRENLNNAFQAQERFMLPGKEHGKDPKFIRRIDRRCDELMHRQQELQKRRKEVEKQGEQDVETKFWK